MSSYLGRLKDELGNIFYPKSYGEQSGPITQTITVDGDADKYYPVLLKITKKLTSHYGYRKINISRGYNIKAPDTWNTSTHKGGLTFSILWSGDGYWGGNDHHLKVLEISQSYSRMIGGYKLATTGLVVWLRGGTAYYYLDSDFNDALTAVVYLNEFTDNAGQVFSLKTTPSTETDYMVDVIPKLNQVYPVGSVYLTMNDSNPSALFGGTWIRVSQGRCLIGTGAAADSLNSTDWAGELNNAGYNFLVGERGGQYRHKLTTNEMASHSHAICYPNAGGPYGNYNIACCEPASTNMTWAAVMCNTESSGSDQPHNIMQPYLAVNIWQRTA